MNRCRRLASWLIAAGAVAAPAHAVAFPPYRSTDAGTADPWTLETRLGLVRVSRGAGVTEYASPLIRANLGLPRGVEIVSEMEYRPQDARVSDAALGAKWVPYQRALGLGVEVLALLPVSSGGGAGLEVSLLSTNKWKMFQMHANLGGMYDARPTVAERGWKGGVIGEMSVGRVRPGVELFARQTARRGVEVLAGPGVIMRFGSIDVRSGLHIGLTAPAPDLEASLWVTRAFAIR